MSISESDRFWLWTQMMVLEARESLRHIVDVWAPLNSKAAQDYLDHLLERAKLSGTNELRLRTKLMGDSHGS